MKNFSYSRPRSLEEAGKILATEGRSAMIAGGMTLVPALKHGTAKPDRLVDLTRIEALKGVSSDNSRVSIGALTTYAEISRDPTINSKIGSLAGLVSNIGDPALRNRGTIGGSLAAGDPSFEIPAAVLALDGVIRTSKREIAADHFFQAGGPMPLERDEIIAMVSLSVPEVASYAVFRGKASTSPLCGVFVAVVEGAVKATVIAVSRNGVFRWHELEKHLTAQQSWRDLPDVPLDPALECLSSIHASEDYRRHLASVLARRATLGLHA